MVALRGTARVIFSGWHFSLELGPRRNTRVPNLEGGNWRLLGINLPLWRLVGVHGQVEDPVAPIAEIIRRVGSAALCSLYKLDGFDGPAGLLATVAQR
jgi:hypothetical protein